MRWFYVNTIPEPFVLNKWKFPAFLCDLSSFRGNPNPSNVWCFTSRLAPFLMALDNDSWAHHRDGKLFLLLSLLVGAFSPHTIVQARHPQCITIRCLAFLRSEVKSFEVELFKLRHVIANFSLFQSTGWRRTSAKLYNPIHRLFPLFSPPSHSAHMIKL